MLQVLNGRNEHFEDLTKIFFILYDNGETFYFSISPDGNISCLEFNKFFETNDIIMPNISIIEFVGNKFYLKSEDGKVIYGLDDYLNDKDFSVFSAQFNDESIIERVYIDSDVRNYLLETGKLIYDEKASCIPGLVEEPFLINPKSKIKRK